MTALKLRPCHLRTSMGIPRGIQSLWVVRWTTIRNRIHTGGSYRRMLVRWSPKAKPSQSSEGGDLRKSTSLCLLAILALERTADSDRHLTLTGGYANANGMESGWGPWLIKQKTSAYEALYLVGGKVPRSGCVTLYEKQDKSAVHWRTHDCDKGTVCFRAFFSELLWSDT